jgi:dienelactone hydrolase
MLAGFVILSASAAVAGNALPPSAFAYDASKPLDVRVARTWHEGALTYDDVTFASPSGNRIHAQIVLPAGEGMHPGVVFVHWLGDPKTTNLTEFLSDARALGTLGFASVLVDAQWAKPHWFEHGRRPGTDFAGSIRQVVDLRRAIDLLCAQPHVDSQRIAYVGHDFGAMYGAVLSGIDARPKAYVLMAGVPSFSQWFLLGAAPKDKAAYVAQMQPLDPPLYLTRATARKFLFQFALKDEYVPLTTAESFAAAAPGERGTYFYSSDHGLANAEVRKDRLLWLETRMLPAARY